MFKGKNIVFLILLLTIFDYSTADTKARIEPCNLAEGCSVVCENGVIGSFGKNFNKAVKNTTCKNVDLAISGYVGQCNKIIPGNWFSQISSSFNIHILRLFNSSFEIIEDKAFTSLHFNSTYHVHFSHINIKRLRRYMFVGLKVLFRLQLEYLPLKRIDKNVLHPLRKSLKVLQVSNIAEPFSLQNLTGSVTLDVEYLHLISDKFGNAINEKSFAGVPGLRELVLVNSGITSLHKNTFDHFGRMYNLWLTGNKLRTLSGRTTQNLLKNNIGIHLENNPWNCDCKLLDLQHQIKTYPNYFPGVLICMSPEKFKNHSIANSTFCSSKPKY